MGGGMTHRSFHELLRDQSLQGVLKTSYLRFPLRARGTEPVRGSPREVGETCRRVAIVNSSPAIGITNAESYLLYSRAKRVQSLYAEKRVAGSGADAVPPGGLP